MKKTSHEKGKLMKCTMGGDAFINIINDYWTNNSSFSFATVRTSALTQDALKTDEDPKEVDFFTKQARLQIEARMALAQAKDIAHLQMEVLTLKMLWFFVIFSFFRFYF